MRLMNIHSRFLTFWQFSTGKLSALLLFIEVYEVNSTEVNLEYGSIRLRSDFCIATKYINSGLKKVWRVRKKTVMLGYSVSEPDLDWVPKQEVFDG